MQLERLLYRDRRTFREASQILIRNHGGGITEDELEDLCTEIPVRQEERVFGGNILEKAPVGEEPTQEEDLADRALVRDTELHLNAALSELDPEDRLVLRMHFVDGLSIAAVARALGLSPPRLYPRVYRIFRTLRRKLREHGIPRSRGLRLLRSRLRLDLDFDEEDERPGPWPSREVT